ncbi:MAG TPA: hypothetical protein VFD92_00675 [Candidatus Binatia bacterium]|nr:hypothetical protein [Candidatus Binatia bacterium]
MGKNPIQTRRAPSRRVFAWVLAVVAGCAGTGGTPSDGGGGTVGGGADPSFATIQREIFDKHCTSAACHSAVARSGSLSLVAGDSYDGLVNVEPDNAAARAAGLLRVAPDQPQKSFLIAKLTGDLQPGEGSSMPLGATPLSDAEIDLVRSWIAAGAMPDGS